MTAEQITALLKTSGLPVVYGYWKKPPPLPYIVWLESGTSNFFADGKVFLRKSRVQAELYTAEKDPEAEQALENALQGIGWEKTSENWLESEKFYQLIYEFEV